MMFRGYFYPAKQFKLQPMRLTLFKKGLGAFMFLCFLAAGTSRAQVSIGSLPYTKTDNFNTYNGSGSATLPAGWSLSGATNYRGTGTGSSNTGGFYAYGSGSDFSLGALRSSTNNYTYAVGFTNNSGNTITSLTISWNYEQWRYANNSGWECTGTGALASNATLNAKDFVGVASGSSGNGTTTSVASFTLSGLNIANGQAFGISWVTTDQASSDNGVSIDDFSIQASGTGGPQSQTIAFGTLSNQTYGITPYVLNGSATSGLAVSFASSNTNVATISGNTITVVGAGTTNITASQAGNTSYNPASNVIRGLTINPKIITATGAVANDKVYDRTNAATITGATANGLVNGDVITINGGGSFANANAGTSKPVTAALLLSGTKASSYTLTQPTGLMAAIAPKDLIIAAASVADKEYDGNTSAVFTGTLSGVIMPDDVALNPEVSFESPFAGTDIPVISNNSLIGADVANYNLVQPALTANITPKPLTISAAVALNKVFDGNTDAVITGILNGVIAPDEVFFNGAGIFESSAVGTNIPVTSVAFLTGDISNYTLVQPTGLAATISAEALVPQNIVFNPLNNAIYGDADFNLNASSDSGLDVIYSSSDSNVAIILGNTITITGVGTTTITATQPGNGTYDTALPVQQILTVTPKELNVVFAAVYNKIYDGNTDAGIIGTPTGIVGDDDVTLSGSGIFASSNAGTGIPVTSAFEMQGADIANYFLVQPTGLAADIFPKTLNVNSITANDKPYDANTMATLENIIFSGAVDSDEVTLSGNGIFASPNVGSGIAVTASLTLDGAQAGNYTFIQPVGLSADITPLALTITGLSAEDKVYDATTHATLSGVAQLNGTIDGEEVTLDGTPVGTFNNKNVGNNKPITLSGYTLSGSSAGNYTLAASVGITASIAAKPLTVIDAVANSKPFDGTTAATLSNTGILSGVALSDVGNVNISASAVFASANIGNDILVNLSLTGSETSNYALVQPGITANITVSPCGSTIVNWNFTTAGPSSAAVSNFSVSALAQGNNNGSTALITSVSASNNAGASGGNNAGAAARIGALNLSSSAYFEFKLTPAAGYKATLTGMNFGSRETGTGPKAYAIRSSLDNFATNLASGTLPASSSWIKYTPVLAPSSGNAGAEVTYRIYGYNGTGSPAAGTANWRIDDLNLNVQLSAALTGNLNPVACSGAGFMYTPASLVSDASFGWTRAAVAGISNAAVTIPQHGDINEVLVNATGSSINVVYAIQVLANNCYTVQNIAVQVLPESLGGSVSGGTTVCPGTNSTTLTLNGYRGTIVKWQSSPIGNFSSAVTDITNASANLQLTNIATATYYRAVVANGACVSANSEVAQITISQLYPFYADVDGDGYGTGTSTNVCAIDANTPPVGFAVLNGDCDDTIAAIHPNAVEVPYNAIDDDCDGTIDETGTVTTSLLASSCGVTLTSIASLIGIQTVAGHPITGYRIRITNGAEVQVIERTVPHFMITQFPVYAYATTYTVDIQLQRAGIWQANYGPACLVSTPAILEEGGAASVSPSQCGIMLAKINTLIATTSLPGVTGYLFRVTNLTDPLGPNAVQTVDRAQNWFSLQMLSRYSYGTTYRIEVAVKTVGAYGGFGAPCEVNSPTAPSLVNCGGTITAGTTAIAATSVSGATQYRFQITRDTDGASATIDRSQNWFIFNLVPAAAFTAGALYNVRVAVMTNGTWSPFGDICQITAPEGLARPMPTGSEVATTDVFKVEAYPNPFAATFAFDIVTSAKENISVKVYDMLGRLLDSEEMKATDVIELGNEYPSGVYNVIVNQGNVVKTLRVVKR